MENHKHHVRAERDYKRAVVTSAKLPALRPGAWAPSVARPLMKVSDQVPAMGAATVCKGP